VIIQKRYWEREESTWGDNAAMDMEDDAYHEEDFANLMVFDANAGTHVLTIHPEMGLTHRHTQLEYPAGGLSREVCTMFTGYFMVLTPEGGKEEPEESMP
jgi:hypothetical protein